MSQLLDIFIGIIHQTLPEPHAGLLSGILFGTKAAIAPALKQSLITTGTLHIIALSGMNITILTVLVHTVLLRIVKRPIANMISIVIIIGFILLVGPSASIVRAAIMGCLSLLAVSLGKRNWPIYGLILAVIIMLLLNPLWAVDLSFQLSVLATIGIILFGKKTKQTDKTHPVYALIEDDLRITLAAQVFTIPLIAFQFQRISLISPVTNILIGWLIAPITSVGLCMVCIGLISVPIASILSWVLWILLQYMLMAIQLTAQIPFASIAW